MRRRDDTGGWLSGTCEYHGEPIGAADRALMRAHVADRPSWICICGDEWPCRIARVTLDEELSRGSDRALLRFVMSAYLHQAATDLMRADPTPGSLYNRFLLWTLTGADAGTAVGSAPVPKP